MHVKRTILVTGATDGLGLRTAERLASPDTLLLIHGRNPDRGDVVVGAIEDMGGGALFCRADFTSLRAVREMAETIAANHPHLDVVVNNAGVGFATGPRRLSQDGYEIHFAVNYLAHFLLIEVLRPCLGQMGASRVINVASASQAPIDFDDVMLERGYDGYRAYSQSKLANVMHSLDLARGREGPGVVSASLHPGTYLDTKLIRAGGGQPMTPVDDGAQAVLALVDAPAATIDGRYFNVRRETRASAQAHDKDARRRLRQLSMTLTGLLSDRSSGPARPGKGLGAGSDQTL